MRQTVPGPEGSLEQVFKARTLSILQEPVCKKAEAEKWPKFKRVTKGQFAHHNFGPVLLNTFIDPASLQVLSYVITLYVQFAKQQTSVHNNIKIEM